MFVLIRCAARLPLSNLCRNLIRVHKIHPKRTGTMYSVFVLLLFIAIVIAKQTMDHTRKNIVVIIADDLGWNDVSIHGTDQILTPNIDMLGYAGVTFARYYSHCICTPSRAALLTGKYAYITGMQGYPLTNSEDRGLAVTEKILPQYLKELGYSTHLVGKWHVGSSRKQYLPTSRGFDTHYGHRGGFVDYYEYTLEETWNTGKVSGLGLFRNNTADWDREGYITDIYNEEAISIIKSHNKTAPLFLMLAHNAPHGSNDGAILQAPSKEVRAMRYVESPQRRIFAAMVKKLDDSVGDIIEALRKKKILNNTIILFISDNGGMTSGNSINFGSNWPLRGIKMSPFEGGVRVPAVLWTPFDIKNHLYEGYVHVTDWLPTLLKGAGMDPPKSLDGYDMWNDIISDNTSKRNKIIEIDDTDGYMSIIYEDYKLITGTVNKLYSNYQGGDFLGIIGEPPSYTNAIKNSKAYKIFEEMGYLLRVGDMKTIRRQLKIKCEQINIKYEAICYPGNGKVCLYDIKNDPCETEDLSEAKPDIVTKLSARLEIERLRVIPRVLPIFRDPKSHPELHNYSWDIFL